MVTTIANFAHFRSTESKIKFIINTEHFPGDSGGAVLNDKGEVIGVIHEKGVTDEDPTDSPFPPVDPHRLLRILLSLEPRTSESVSKFSGTHS